MKIKNNPILNFVSTTLLSKGLKAVAYAFNFVIEGVQCEDPSIK